MPVDLYASAYTKSSGNHPNCDNSCRDVDVSCRPYEPDTFVFVHTKGSPGRRKHWYANTKVDASGNVESGNDCIRWTPPSNPPAEGHNPCKGLGESTLINPGGNDFDAGAFGLRCSVPEYKVEDIIARGSDSSITGPTVIDRHNSRVDFLDQILFGGFTKSGKPFGPVNPNRSRGYCADVANLEKVVREGKTCGELLEGKLSEWEMKTKFQDMCQLDRTNPQCQCLNVLGPDFAERCKTNPTWAGCDLINEKRKRVEKMLCPFGSGQECPALANYGANAECLVPGICDSALTEYVSGSDTPTSEIYTAKDRPPSCTIQMNVCNQLMMVENPQVLTGDMEISQTCNINVDKLMNDKKLLDAAIKQAKEQDELWKENQFQLQKLREDRLMRDAAEMERIRQEMADAQALDRAAERDLASQVIAHRSANAEKRMNERMAFDQRMAEMEAARIGGKDPQTLAFYAAVVFCAVFMLIFAVKI